MAGQINGVGRSHTTTLPVTAIRLRCPASHIAETLSDFRASSCNVAADIGRLARGMVTPFPLLPEVDLGLAFGKSRGSRWSR